MKIEEVNKLKDAVIRRYYPNFIEGPGYFNEREYQNRREILSDIDAKVLWVIQVGITAEELINEANDIEKERERERERLSEIAKEMNKKGDEIKYEIKHEHEWVYKRTGFLKFKKGCKYCGRWKNDIGKK